MKQITLSTLLFALLTPPAQATVIEIDLEGTVITHETQDFRYQESKKPALSAQDKSLIDALVASAAVNHNIDEDVIHAVIRAESGYNSTAISPKGAEGLMQLMPATAERFHVKDSFNMAQNINGGAAYLKWLLEYFKGNEQFALAAYNAGEKAVDKYHGIPPYSETKAYVERIERFLGRKLRTHETQSSEM